MNKMCVCMKAVSLFFFFRLCLFFFFCFFVFASTRKRRNFFSFVDVVWFILIRLSNDFPTFWLLIKRGEGVRFFFSDFLFFVSSPFTYGTNSLCYNKKNHLLHKQQRYKERGGEREREENEKNKKKLIITRCLI